MAASIGPRLKAFMESGVALLAATRNADLAPGVVRAGGCRVGDDGSVTILLAPEQARRCLDDALANGHVVLLCVMPQTYECYQVKGAGARVAELDMNGHVIAARYRTALLANLRVVGVEPAAAAGLLPEDPAAFVGLTFDPAEIHCNTPGPIAGDEVTRATGGP